MIKILGIETSCDETAAAVIAENKEIISNKIFSQINLHKSYGGVVPEIAARSHLDYIDIIVKETLNEANLTINDIDAIAVTSGPGLIGGVIIGVMYAKAIALVNSKPIIPINHLEGHALSVRLVSDISYPYLLLLISGGHCQILYIENLGKYRLLGETLDDAIGEAFDKLSKMMDLGYPGGPIIEKYAKYGNENRYKLPLSMVGREGCDISCSGIKTSMRKIIAQTHEFNLQDKYDLAASFQYVISEIIMDRLKNALEMINYETKTLAIAGGVGANQYIKIRLENFAKNHNLNLVIPPPSLCTDNAAMIAWAGIENYKACNLGDLNFEPRANWPLSY